MSNLKSIWERVHKLKSPETTHRHLTHQSYRQVGCNLHKNRTKRSKGNTLWTIADMYHHTTYTGMLNIKGQSLKFKRCLKNCLRYHDCAKSWVFLYFVQGYHCIHCVWQTVSTSVLVHSYWHGSTLKVGSPLPGVMHIKYARPKSKMPKNKIPL